MKYKTPLFFTYTGKLILIFLSMLITAGLIIGVTAYRISHNELNKKGEHILKNSVTLATEFIQSQYNDVQEGIITEEYGKESIKEVLLGPKDVYTGYRILHKNIDLGENGYFIIYNSEGLEIMHPSLEGENVFNVTDMKDYSRYIVQEQIEAGINGGGFVYYSWTFPRSSRVGKKISYSSYFPEWDWIIVSTAYELDFNRAANQILVVLVSIISLIIIVASVVIIIYVRSKTKPIAEVVSGMVGITDNRYELVDEVRYRDELSYLVTGYNNMVNSLKAAHDSIDKKEQFINYIAFHDELTKLPNRYGIENYVTERIENGCESGFLVQMDIMGLKVINSTLGFVQGDLLLKLVGKYLIDISDEKSYIARTSSNEFTFWFENITYEEVSDYIYSQRKSLKEYIKKEGFGKIIDMQLALTQYPMQGASFADLYEKVSIAMKSAKDTKSLNITEYHEDIHKALQNELSMKSYLSTAISSGEIVPYYQAQVDYTKEKVIGVEALARWYSKELGVVSLALFIPAIDSLNMITEFTNYMIDRVLQDYSELQKKYNSDIKVSVNISPAYFVDPGCYDYLLDIFSKHMIPHGKLILEITEDVFISDPKKINDIIDNLHKLGILISIDDFGTGYSSLNYLAEMNFDEMKIDKSFIDKILIDDKSFQLFKILCDIAKIYNYEIVAEGVETEKQLEMIKNTSLRIIQGYLFSKPEPL